MDLRVILIKPSKYAEDGSVERFWRGFMPNSTLNHMYSMTLAYMRNSGAEIDLSAFDEYVQDKLDYLKLIRGDGIPTLVALVGVQSHQFHRALDLAALARRQSPPPPRAAVTPAASAVSTLPVEDPQSLSALETFRRDVAPLPGGGAAALQAGLEEIDQGYNQAYANLFPEVASGVTFPGEQNPFEEAPANAGTDSGTGDSPDSNTNPTDPGEAPAPEVDSGNTPPPGGGGGDGTTPEPDSPPEDIPTPRPLYNFLVIGDLQGNGSLVSRANLLDNTLVLENSLEISFFPGSLHSLLVFTEGERLFTTDLDRDGSIDFVLIRVVPAVGSSVESYLQVAPGRFELHGSAAFFLQEVTALALYDVTGDEREELVLLMRGSDHLFVYELQNRDWTYLYELVLPFSPSTLMVSSAGAPLGTRLLYVVDESLRYVVNLNSRQPDRLRFGSRAPLNHLITLAVDWLGSGEQPMLIFGLQDVLLLAEQRGGTLETIAAFDTRSRVPVVILGDYLGIGERQLLWLP